MFTAYIKYISLLLISGLILTFYGSDPSLTDCLPQWLLMILGISS